MLIDSFIVGRGFINISCLVVDCLEMVRVWSGQVVYMICFVDGVFVEAMSL